MSHCPLSNRTYLLVEDEYHAASDLMTCLEEVGARVLGPVSQTCLEEVGARVLGPVSHLNHAMEISRQLLTIDAAILDVNLHGELVFPFARHLIERNVVVVFVSGYSLADIPPQYRALPFFEKPVDKVALIARLAKLCR